MSNEKPVEVILKHLIDALKHSSFMDAQQVLLKNVNTKNDRLIAARLLDQIIKSIKNLLLEQKRAAQQIQDEMARRDPISRFEDKRKPFMKKVVTSIVFKIIRVTLSKPLEDIIKREFTSTHDQLEKCQYLRKTILFTDEEENEIYRNVNSLYQEQANNRKWYQQGITAIIMSIIFFPLSPFIYYFWKKERDREILQENPHTREQREEIRENRKIFKRLVNQSDDNKMVFNTEKKNNSIGKEPKKYITKYKKERDAFFSKHRFAMFQEITEEQIQAILESRKQDEDFRLSTGMR